MQAVGIHVFAGGFTQGVKSVADVICQLEKGTFGNETVTQQLKVPVYISKTAKWDTIPCDLVYGNPRCSAFSTVTKFSRGPASHINIDMHEVCAYAQQVRAPFAIIESVQQAHTQGRPLFQILYDTYFGKDYRVARILFSAFSFGNCQRRRRFFWIAYHRDFTFHAKLPERDNNTTLRDVIEPLEHFATEPCTFKKNDRYSPDSYPWRDQPINLLVSHIPEGRCANDVVLENPHLADLHPLLKIAWKYRVSSMPYGLGCPYRPRYDGNSPTLTSQSGWVLHPKFDRTLTVREHAAIMGWRVMPLGPHPLQQLCKGVIPDIGMWIVQQVQNSVNTKYLDLAFQKGQWIELKGQPVEKIFDFNGEVTRDVR